MLSGFRRDGTWLAEMGDAYSGRSCSPGRSVCAHHGVIQNVFRRRAQWPHAGTVSAYQR